VRAGESLLAALAMVALATAASAGPVGAAPCWFPPVAGIVVDPFREPPCTWCAGNRGLDYRVGPDVAVRAAAGGRVVFSGAVAGVVYVVVRLPNGWRHTYGQLTSTALRIGDAVIGGSMVGRAGGAFFFGLRIGDDYADPARFIGELRSRPRLIPTDASPPRPGPPARPHCGAPSRRGAPPSAR
jgi:murein DD-endopeptidase MepM/ murein hydrolase activator NlpD